MQRGHPRLYRQCQREYRLWSKTPFQDAERRKLARSTSPIEMARTAVSSTTLEMFEPSYSYSIPFGRAVSISSQAGAGLGFIALRVFANGVCRAKRNSFCREKLRSNFHDSCAGHYIRHRNGKGPHNRYDRS